MVKISIIWKIVFSCIRRTKNRVSYYSYDGSMYSFLWYVLVLEKFTFILRIFNKWS